MPTIRTSQIRQLWEAVNQSRETGPAAHRPQHKDIKITSIAVTRQQVDRQKFETSARPCKNLRDKLDGFADQKRISGMMMNEGDGGRLHVSPLRRFTGWFFLCLPPSQPLPHPSPVLYTVAKKISAVQQLPLFQTKTAGGWGVVLWFVAALAGVPQPQRVLVTINCEHTPLQRACSWLLPITDSADCAQRMADNEQNNQDPDHNEEEEEENEGPRGARRRRGAEVPLDALLRRLAGQRVIVREREAAGGNDELIAGLKRSGMLSRCESDCCSSVQPQFRRVLGASRPVTPLILL